MRSQRQRLEQCISKPRDAKDGRPLPEARREAWDSFSPEPPGGTSPVDALSLASEPRVGLLGSRTAAS